MILCSEAEDWIHDIVDRAKKLKVNAGHIAGTDVGPVISPAAKKRIEDLIQSAIDEGATVLLDGRGIKVPLFEVLVSFCVCSFRIKFCSHKNSVAHLYYESFIYFFLLSIWFSFIYV